VSENRGLREMASPSSTRGKGGVEAGTEARAERSFDRISGRSNGRSAWGLAREADGGVFWSSDLQSNDLKKFPACSKTLGVE
jgi:hypothetical protein